MLPFVWPAARVRVESCAYEDLALGDLVLFERHQRVYLHRVVEGGAAGWITQGDAHDSPDGPLQPDEVIGRAHGVVIGRRHFSRVHPLCANTANRAVLVLAPGVRKMRRHLVRLHHWLGRPATRCHAWYCEHQRMEVHALDRDDLSKIRDRRLRAGLPTSASHLTALLPYLDRVQGRLALGLWRTRELMALVLLEAPNPGRWVLQRSEVFFRRPGQVIEKRLLDQVIQLAAQHRIHVVSVVNKLS